METIIIKLWDNEEYNYPRIEIKEKGFNSFKRILKKYQNVEDYNLDFFLGLIQKEKWFIRIIDFDEEVFF